jgi:hypothetical protein
VLCLGTVLCATSASAAETLLRWQFREGQRLHVRIGQVTKTETVVGDTTSTLAMEMILEMDWQVTRVDKGTSARLTQKFTRLALKSTSPEGTTVAYDSDSKDAVAEEMEDVASAARPLLQSTFHAAMTDRGEITSVSLPAETDSLLRSGPDLARIRQLLTTHGIQQVLRQSLGVLPEQAVNTGDTWNRQGTVDSPQGKITFDSRFSYEGAQQYQGRQVERISVATDIALDAEDAAADGGPQRKPQAMTGSILFDNQSGHLFRSVTHQKLQSSTPFREGTITVRANSSVWTHIEAVR